MVDQRKEEGGGHKNWESSEWITVRWCSATINSSRGGCRV